MQFISTYSSNCEIHIIFFVLVKNHIQKFPITQQICNSEEETAVLVKITKRVY
jgi:hypothetical protein